MGRTAQKFPKKAKMVFKGEIFEIWQWEQKMFDGSTAIFEELRRPDTAQVIPVVDDKILIQEQEQPHRVEPFLSLAGGRCEKDEDPLAAAKRELLEETGYQSGNWILWKSRTSGKMNWAIYTYIARNCRYLRAPQPDAGERITNKLVSFDEFLALADDPKFYDNELVSVLLRARYDAEFRERFRMEVFGQ